jgi:thiosulfate dehydrogenase [quinone] large subunit
MMQDHPIEIALFNETGPVTWLWLVLRVWLGWQWAAAGWDKIQNPRWMDGMQLREIWQNAIGQAGQPYSNVAYDWYGDLLGTLAANGAETWLAPVAAFGELFAGVCLILGLFTGFAALGAAFLSFNFMLAGSGGANPVYFLFALVLIMAWKNAGWWGLDRFVLPALGTPWHPGTVFHHARPQDYPLPPEA